MNIWSYAAASLAIAAAYAGIGILSRRIWERATGRNDDRTR